MLAICILFTSGDASVVAQDLEELNEMQVEVDCSSPAEMPVSEAKALMERVRADLDGKEEDRYGWCRDLYCSSAADQDHMLKAFAANQLGLYFYQKRNRFASLRYLNEAYDLLKGDPENLLYAENQNYLGLLYHFTMEYPQAIHHLQAFLSAAKKHENEEMIANANADLGLVYLDAGDYDLAKIFLQKSHDFLVNAEDEYALAYALLNLGRVEIAKEDVGKGIGLIQEAVDIWKPLDFDRGLFYSYSVLADVMRTLDSDQALAYAKQAEQIALRSDYFSLGNTYRVLGNIYYDRKDYDNVELAYRKCIQYAMEHSELELFDDAYLTLLDIYQFREQYDKVAELAEQSAKVYNELLSRNRKQNEAWLSAQRRLLQSEEEVTAQRRISTQRKSYIWILAALLIGLTALFILLFKSYRDLRTVHSNLKASNHDLAAKTSTLQETQVTMREQSQRLEQFIERNTMLQANRKELIENLSRKLSSTDDTHPLIKELRQIVRTSLALDDETETNYFTLYRNQEFVDRLLKAHSNLTEGEIRLSNYLRLGLSSKEIANLLFMNPDSVKVARSRLRKKLGLTERSTSLSGYLQKFISPVD